MRLKVKLFAAVRDAVGQEEIEVEVPDECADVAVLKARLLEAFPELAGLLSHVLFAVDSEYASDQTELTADSEIACIPPVSGG